MAGYRGQRYAMARPGPLAALAVGQGDLYPYYFKMTNRSKQTFINNDEIENPTNLLAGRFDLGFVTVFLFPLLILAMSYNLISAEREQGTLAMALAQPVRLRTLAMGKAAFRAAVVLTLAIGLAKGIIDAAGLPALDETLEQEVTAQALCAASDDFAEATRAFVEKRAPSFSGH